MMKLIFFLIIVTNAFGSELQKIDTLGTSTKGQFVALEEYGYKAQNHSYFVKIQVVNVWTEQYVGDPIEVELPAFRPYVLGKARTRARELAQDVLKKYDIKG